MRRSRCSGGEHSITGSDFDAGAHPTWREGLRQRALGSDTRCDHRLGLPPGAATGLEDV